MKSEWNINITGDIFKGLENVLTAADKLESEYKQVEQVLNHAFTTPVASLEKFGSTVFKVRNAFQGVDEIARSIWGMVEPVVAFDKKARELQSITNVTEPVLNQIKGFAQETARTFGGDAANYLETYKILLSKLGPELADKPELLKAMGVNVAILSKSMGNDAFGAVDVLTTAMNQYGVSIDDPLAATEAMTEMMNQMQAGAIAGSSELPELKAGIAASGAMAKAAGLQFAELNAALQVLDKGSKKGAEGGTALRNVLARMGEGRFMPEKTMKALSEAGVNIDVLGNKTLSFKQRLTELSKIKGDSELVSQFFGVENVAAGQFMLENIELLGEFTKKIEENKDAAVASAETVMKSHEEKMSRTFAFFNNLKISLGEIFGSAVPYIHELTTVTGGLLQTMPGIVALIDLWGMLAKSQKVMTFLTNLQTAATVGLIVVQELLTMAFVSSPWGWVALAIGAIIAAIVIAWKKFEGFRAVVYGLGYAFKQVFTNIVGFFKSLLAPVFEAIDFAMQGEWKKAAKAGAKALVGLSPVGIAVQATQFAVGGGLTKGVAEAYKKGEAAGREAFQKEKAAEKKQEEKKESGIIPGVPSLPEMDLGIRSPGSPAAYGGGRGGSGSSDRSRFTNVTIHIAKLFDNIVIHTTTFKESVARVEDELLRVVTNATNNLNPIL
jgi:TP901 family phage tail tape measure protein